jgi:hypothetical protein
VEAMQNAGKSDNFKEYISDDIFLEEEFESEESEDTNKSKFTIPEDFTSEFSD